MIHFADSFRIPGRTRWFKLLILFNIISFAATHWYSQRTAPVVMPANAELFLIGGGVIPAEYLYPEQLEEVIVDFGPAAGLTLSQLRPPALMTLFWSLFLHANFLHLLMNMFFLYQLGRNVEAYMGSMRFLLFYFSCGAAGMLAQILYDLDSLAPIVGASGAISGLIGAYWMLFPDHDFRLTIGQYHKQYRDYVLPFKTLLIIWILNQVLLLIPDQQEIQSVAVFAHLGGFACGLLLARSREDRNRRKRFKVVTGGQQEAGGPYWGND